MRWPWSRLWSSKVETFRESMQIDYRKWHDGIGYDVDLIAACNDQERREIEAILLQRGVKDWRDVEALAALGNRQALRRAAECGVFELEIAVVEHAAQYLSADERDAIIVRALAHSDIGTGLAQSLRAAAAYPTPAVVDALQRACTERQPGLKVLFEEALQAICRSSSSASSS